MRRHDAAVVILAEHDYEKLAGKKGDFKRFLLAEGPVESSCVSHGGSNRSKLWRARHVYSWRSSHLGEVVVDQFIAGRANAATSPSQLRPITRQLTFSDRKSE